MPCFMQHIHDASHMIISFIHVMSAKNLWQIKCNLAPYDIIFLQLEFKQTLY